MAENSQQQLPTVVQEQFQDDQDIFNLDFDQLSSSFILAIDAIRSHFNALEPNSEELNTPQFQESRCHAFYRMIGFPIVANETEPLSFHSPGFDPNLNTDISSINTYQQIDTKVINNTSLINQFRSREQIPLSYSSVFSSSDITSQALALASIFIREFDKQLGKTSPLISDPNSTQTINERFTDLQDYFGDKITDEILQFVSKSIHQLKPFVVDPRIDNTIRPIKNRVCAPFLKDKSQTRIFQSSAGSFESLKRPFIERVISIRFNNKNVTTNPGGSFINQILTDVSESSMFIDTQLADTLANPLKQLHNSELTIFNAYYRIMKILVEQLTEAIKEIQKNRQKINFNPIPDPKFGVESGTNGGKLGALSPNDKNNKELDNNIIALTQKKFLNDITFDTGLQAVPDPGDFVFSNLEDSVFSINKNIQKSYDENIEKGTKLREAYGNQSIDFLKNIEIIMGEFSGIGLIDIVAIQAALWIMPQASLLGLIDTRALQRIADFRPDINIKGTDNNPVVPDDVITSLENFEKTLSIIYSIIQDYYKGINNGDIFKV